MIDAQMSEARFAELHPRIQAKVLAARAAAERRETRAETREALKDWLRFEELRATPVASRTPSERSEFQRLYRAQRKRKENGEQTSIERVDDHIRSKEEFWKLQRLSLTAQMPAWLEREPVVYDTLAWFDRLDKGRETEELCAENYLSAVDGLGDVLQDIEEHGVAHLGYIHENEDIPADFSDGYFSGRAFYRDAEVFRLLCQEGESTRVYATTGILISLPDWRVVEFLANHCGWSVRRAQEFVGFRFSDNTVTVRYPEGTSPRP